jgi:ribosomal protein L15
LEPAPSNSLSEKTYEEVSSSREVEGGTAFPEETDKEEISPWEFSKEESSSDVPVEEETSPLNIFDNECCEPNEAILDFVDCDSPEATEDIRSSETAAYNVSIEEKEYISEEMIDTTLSNTEDIIPEESEDSIDLNSVAAEFTEITSIYDAEFLETTNISESSHQQATESEEPKVEIKMEYANSAITNALAKRLIKDEREVIYTSGRVKSVINVDTLSRSFLADDRVDVNILKKKSLVPYDTNYIKVLARGAIDKPLHVYANEFSLAAVKMILLSGGEAIRVISEKSEKNKTKD